MNINSYLNWAGTYGIVVRRAQYFFCTTMVVSLTTVLMMVTCSFSVTVCVVDLMTFVL